MRPCRPRPTGAANLEAQMSSIALLGLFAGAITTLSFLPQVVKAWRTRHTRDLSTAWLVAFTGGIFLWLIYGLLTDDLAIISANAVTLLLCVCLVTLKLRDGD